MSIPRARRGSGELDEPVARRTVSVARGGKAPAVGHQADDRHPGRESHRGIPGSRRHQQPRELDDAGAEVEQAQPRDAAAHHVHRQDRLGQGIRLDEEVAVPEARPRCDQQDQAHFEEVDDQQGTTEAFAHGTTERAGPNPSWRVGSRSGQRPRPEGTAVRRRVPVPAERGQVRPRGVPLVAIEAVARVVGACSSIMCRSRVTLATMDAAAMAAQRRSPPTTRCCGSGRSGTSNPSTITKSGRGARACTARRIASSEAWWMLTRSMSRGSTATTVQLPARTIRYRTAARGGPASGAWSPGGRRRLARDRGRPPPPPPGRQDSRARPRRRRRPERTRAAAARSRASAARRHVSMQPRMAPGSRALQRRAGESSGGEARGGAPPCL